MGPLFWLWILPALVGMCIVHKTANRNDTRGDILGLMATMWVPVIGLVLVAGAILSWEPLQRWLDDRWVD